MARSIYVSDNGGPFSVWLSKTSLTQANYTGTSGHSYGFYSIAQDSAGTLENPKSVADTSTTINTTRPISHVSALPVSEISPNFLVQWSGTDVGGPGLANYSVYVYDNGVLSIWQMNTIARQAWYTGTIGQTYGFFSIAQDINGTQEEMKYVPDATTTAPMKAMAQDVNHDGQISCADVDLVKAAFGQKDSAPNFIAADVNQDGVVNVLDLAMVTRLLPPGSACE